MHPSVVMSQKQFMGMQETLIIRHDLFRDWAAVRPDKFTGITNGITPRRWLGLCNPELTWMLED